MPGEDLRLPGVWLATDFKNYRIVDPDGWCGPNALSFDVPISREDFRRRLMASTIEHHSHPWPEDKQEDPGQGELFDASRAKTYLHTKNPHTSPGKEVSRWADAAMFRSEQMPTNSSGRVGPSVALLNATPDPLGSLAALQGIYTGRVVRSLSELSDDDRRTAYTEVTKNKLQGSLEVVQFHFLVEGVTRSFTHQMVRERQAFFAQESMRFAVVDGESWIDRIPVPPSIPADPHSIQESLIRDVWCDAIINAENHYHALIDYGVPAEDARGLMPHAMTTRLHWVTDLRGLLYVAGLRLCTQAQFEWRVVMAQVVKTLREYRKGPLLGPANTFANDSWQFQLIADSLRPICYQEGKCGFKSKMDRPCTIRDRVDANERIGRSSEYWGQPVISGGRLGQNGDPTMFGGKIKIAAIHPYEWAADPTSARRAEGKQQGDEK